MGAQRGLTAGTQRERATGQQREHIRAQSATGPAGSTQQRHKGTLRGHSGNRQREHIRCTSEHTARRARKAAPAPAEQNKNMPGTQMTSHLRPKCDWPGRAGTHRDPHSVKTKWAPYQRPGATSREFLVFRRISATVGRSSDSWPSASPSASSCQLEWARQLTERGGRET